MLNKEALIELVSEKTNLSRHDTDAVVNAVLDVIAETMQRGECVRIKCFGVFDVKERAAHAAQNPQNQQVIRVPKRRTAKFRASQSLKDAIARRD